MKHIFILVISSLLVFSCKNNPSENLEVSEGKNELTYVSFGEEIVADQAVELASMVENYKTMKVGDSVSTKLIGKVDQVCQSKGCWMKMDLGNDEQVMVRSEEHTSELQSRPHLVCRLLLEKKKKKKKKQENT